MFLVLGFIFGSVSKVRAPLLSSNTIDLMINEFPLPIFISLLNLLKNSGMNFLIAWLSALYSTSVLIYFITTSNLNTQYTVHSFNIVTYSALLLTHTGS